MEGTFYIKKLGEGLYQLTDGPNKIWDKFKYLEEKDRKKIKKKLERGEGKQA